MADLEPISNLQQQSEASSSSRVAGLSPIARIFRGDIGRMIIIVLMPLTMAFMTTDDAPLSLPMRKFVFCSLTIGLTALLHGVWPESNFPARHAMLMDQIGAGFVLVALYGVIISFLPDNLKWIPLASVLMLLLMCFSQIT